MTTVVVADDDPDIRDLFASKLEQIGVEVVAVGTGTLPLKRAVEPLLTWRCWA